MRCCIPCHIPISFLSHTAGLPTFTNDFDSATHAKHISQSRLQYPTTATTVHGAGNYFDCTPRLTTHLTKHIVLYI